MGETLITIIFNLFHALLSTFLGPVIQGLENLIAFLGLSSLTHLFTDLLTTYIGPLVGFFFEFMGPNTISVIMLEIGTTIIYYAIKFSKP